MTALEFWFDAQQKRFLEQIVRAFSGFQWQDGNGNLHSVPCTMAKADRLVASIIHENSENMMIPVPQITIFQSGLEFRREDLQNTRHVDTRQVWERAIDPATGKYTGQGGNKYTVERLMPRPFMMKIQADIWTSNLEQKHQLSEQILTVFCPNIEIQNSDNPLDWSAKTYLAVDDIVWTSKTVSPGTENEMDIMTINMSLPMWLSPPAKVKQQKIIEQIITNINNVTEEIIQNISIDGNVVPAFVPADAANSAQIVTTPNDASIIIDTNNNITLVGPRGSLYDRNGNVYNWSMYLQQYGTVTANSTIHLKTTSLTSNVSQDIVGTFTFSNVANQLIWTPNAATFPAETLAPVDAIINPLRSYPGVAGLAVANTGQSYLIVTDIENNPTWGNSLVARENDIITYDGTNWNVTFNSAASADTWQYVLNENTNTRLKWNGKEWIMLLAGEYGPGWWRIAL